MSCLPLSKFPLKVWHTHTSGEARPQASAEWINGDGAGASEPGQAMPVHRRCCSSHHHSCRNRTWRGWALPHGGVRQRQPGLWMWHGGSCSWSSGGSSWGCPWPRDQGTKVLGVRNERMCSIKCLSSIWVNHHPVAVQTASAPVCLLPLDRRLHSLVFYLLFCVSICWCLCVLFRIFSFNLYS